MKNLSKVVLKLLKHKSSSLCLHHKNREDTEQKTLNIPLGFSKGFTLIELLVVVLIIGILSAVALPQYRKAVLKSRITQGLVTLSALDKAQQEYKLANGEYTNSLEDLSISFNDEGLSCGEKSYCHTRISDNIFIEIALGVKMSDFGKWRCKARTSDSLAIEICKSYGEVVQEINGKIYYNMDL
ncbi:type IV pilin protein [Candidatus Avelusimicrobium sp.]